MLSLKYDTYYHRNLYGYPGRIKASITGAALVSNASETFAALAKVSYNVLVKILAKDN